MNPILDERFFVPDCEARVMPDGRLYIYGSYDLLNNGYCSKEQHLFSTSDLENWKHHGVIFSTKEGSENGVPFRSETMLYAPDAIYNNGKYYLYICGPSEKGWYEGVAVADSPEGPFSPAEEIIGAYGIDPSVFVDDDGQAYYFWGQFTLKGAKLKSDMKTLEEVKDGILTEWEHGFHEGSSIRKRGDKYYMVYTDISRGKATCLGYAISDKPLGPYKKCGIIIDNIGCDPKTWNNHGSIACFKDKWYVFYHRSSNNGDGCRRVCIEPIEFDENGLIKEVPITSQGVSSALDAFSEIKSRYACNLFRNAYIETIDENEYLVFSGEKHWDTPDFAAFKYIDFKDGANKASIKLKGEGKITLKIEDNKEIASYKYSLNSFDEICFDIEKTEGIHTLWMFVEGKKTEILSFKFE